MKALTIKDLSRTEELDRSALAAVRGGWNMDKYYKFGDVNFAPSSDSSITASQDIKQAQSVFNATANGSAFLHDIDVHNTVTQDAKNVIVA